jgi:hypothetical protein
MWRRLDRLLAGNSIVDAAVIEGVVHHHRFGPRGAVERLLGDAQSLRIQLLLKERVWIFCAAA